MKHRLLFYLAAMAVVLLWTSHGTTTSVILVDSAAVWKYFDQGTDLGTTWRAIGFNDSTWSSGPAQLGYGDGDEATLVGYGPDVMNKYVTTYFRKTFTVADPSLYQSLTLNLLRDDGAVVYLNGTQVFSSNMPATQIGYKTYASTVVGGADESTFFVASINPALLVAGANLLAIEIHQANATSSDIGFNASLVASTNLQLTRGPYLQMGTSSSVVIRWRTGGAADSQVFYGSGPAQLTASVNNPAVTTEHEVEVSGLSPFTKYYYSVGSSTQTLAGGDASHAFVTAPATGTAVPTRVWVLGDSGTADANARAVRDAYYAYAGTTPTNLWLMLGDNAYQQGLDTEYQAAVFDMYPATLRQSVLWPTLGNHDGAAANSSAGTGPYYDMFTLPKQAQAGGLASGTEAYFSFDYGDIHFINLESFETNRAAGSPMLTWLQNDIASTTQKWIVAFWHHPPYSKGSHDSDVDIEMREMRENALPILEAAGVDLVLTGHSHSYERSFLIDGHYGLSSTFNSTMKKSSGSGQKENTGAYIKPSAGGAPHAGAVYAVAGSSGGLGGGALNHPAMFVSLNLLGSMVLDFANGELTANFLDNTGVIRDHFTIQKGSATAPTITTAALPDGVLSSPYSATLTATGGVQPYAWAISSGALPSGLSLASASGIISGTPSGPAGTSTFDVRVSGQGGLFSTRTLTLRTVGPSAPGAFAKATPKNNAKNVSRSARLTWTASSGATSYEYCYDAINNGVCDGTWRAAGTALQASLSGLAAQTTFYWQVRSQNAGGTTLANGGTWWSFVTARNQ